MYFVDVALNWLIRSLLIIRVTFLHDSKNLSAISKFESVIAWS